MRLQESPRLFVPGPNPMPFYSLLGVMRLGGNLQIFNPIVLPIVVNMMNNLVRFKAAANMLLHDVAVLSSVIFFSHPNHFIAILYKIPLSNFIFRFNRYSKRPTPLRAKHSSALIKVAPLYLVFQTAIKAGNYVIKTPLRARDFLNNSMSIHNIMIHERIEQ